MREDKDSESSTCIIAPDALQRIGQMDRLAIGRVVSTCAYYSNADQVTDKAG